MRVSLLVFLASGCLLTSGCAAVSTAAVQTAVEAAVETASEDSEETPAQPQAGFRAAVQAHLAAIERRDLEALLATVTTRDSLTLILPDGTMLRTRQAYADFHEAWFAEPGWTMTFDPVTTIETPALSTALYRTTYEGTDAAGQPSRRQSYLTLVFAEEDGAWRLLFDQNTRVQPQP